MQNVESALGGINFLILVVVTVLIAAAGYIINDYYDIEIDRINKPQKNLIGRDISTMTARIMYYALNIIAIGLGFYLALRVSSFQLGFVFVIIIIMLWYYSSRYKRMIFWGNLVVGILSGFVVFVVWLFEFFALRADPGKFIEAIKGLATIKYFIWGFSFFAFITSIIREMIKDIQDMEGDERTGCRTIPIAIGFQNTKFIILGVIIISMAVLGYAQYLLFKEGFEWACWYLLITVQLLHIYVIVKMFSAREAKKFSFLSSLMKVIMVAGIISMQLIYFDY